MRSQDVGALANSTDATPNDAGQMVGFEAWVSEEVLSGKFKPETIVVYRSIWLTWIDWLKNRNTDWKCASGRDILDFLSGPAPGTKRHRKSIRSDGLANFTKQRYWRVLRGVYAWAKRSEVVESNPTNDVPEHQRPSINVRSLKPQVMPPGVLEYLQIPENINALIEVEKDTHWWSLRNRSVFSVLVHLGLTTAELGQLKGRDLRVNGIAWVDQIGEPAQQSLEQKHARVDVWLDIPKGGALAARSLEVPLAVQRHLKTFLLARRYLYSTRLLSQWRLDGSHRSRSYEQDLITLLRDAPLFPSRKCVGGDKTVLPGLDEVTIFELVQKTMRAYFTTSHGKEVDPRSHGIYIGLGAAVIRNSLIAQWVARLGPEEAVARSGFASQESLRQHTAVQGKYARDEPID